MLVVKVQVGDSLHKIKVKEPTSNSLRDGLVSRLAVQRDQIKLFTSNGEEITTEIQFSELLKLAKDEDRCPKVVCTITNSSSNFTSAFSQDTSLHCSNFFSVTDEFMAEQEITENIVSKEEEKKAQNEKIDAPIKKIPKDLASKRKAGNPVTEAFKKVHKKILATNPDLNSSPELLAYLIDSCKSKIVKTIMKQFEEEVAKKTLPVLLENYKREPKKEENLKTHVKKEKKSKGKSEKTSLKKDVLKKKLEVIQSKIIEVDQEFITIPLTLTPSMEIEKPAALPKKDKSKSSKKPTKSAAQKPKIALRDETLVLGTTLTKDDSFIDLLEEVREANPELSVRNNIETLVKDEVRPQITKEEFTLQIQMESPKPLEGIAHNKREQDPDLEGWTLL